jgi:DNA-binding CsgD family transcriptional regulator
VHVNFPGRLVLLALAIATAITALLGILETLLTGEQMTAGGLASDFVEMLVLSVAMVVSIVLVERMKGLEDKTTQMHAEISEAADAGRAWRAQSEHLFEGLSAAVATQFDTWGLTEAEASVAALILKGAALKDIAALRKTSDATIRQQAQQIYRKSGLGNRSELAAFFLEDLFDVAAGRAAIQNASEPKH